MKKLLVLSYILAFASCESDSSGQCSAEQWVGEYTIEVENTSCNSTLSIVQVSGNTLNLNSIEGQRDGCSFNSPTFQVEATLSGTNIVFSGLGCTATYIKN